MKSLLFLPVMIFCLLACNNMIKNEDNPVVVESGTEVLDANPADNPVLEESRTDLSESVDEILSDELKADFKGFWVGYFVEDYKPEVWSEEGYELYEEDLYDDYWIDANKINISIDEITGNKVKGHSVVAGNDRPFEGELKLDAKVLNLKVDYLFEVAEPGDDKYDGEFTFYIQDNVLTGKWTAYKDVRIKHRAYSLKKTGFEYNPDVELEQIKHYVDWNNEKRNQGDL